MGGVERHVEGLSAELAKRGHEVIVYTRPNYTPKELNEFKGVKLVSLPTLNSKHFDAISHTFFACLDIIFNRKVDVVHFHSIGPCLLIWMIKLFKPKAHLVATFHCQDYNHKKWNRFAKLSLKIGEFFCCSLADEVITVSKDLKTYADLHYNIEAHYLPNGASVEEPLPAQRITKRWNLRKHDFVITASRLVRHKGIHYVIEAFKNLNTNKKLVIVGDGFFTDDYVEELKSLAMENGNILFVGSQSGEILRELYSNAYLVLQPSEAEGLSVVLLDAMSNGAAVLSSDIPANVEAMGDVGFYFKNGDVSDLEKQMKYLFEHEELVLHKAGQGVDRIRKYFDWEILAAQVEQVYNMKKIKTVKVFSEGDV